MALAVPTKRHRKTSFTAFFSSSHKAPSAPDGLVADQTPGAAADAANGMKPGAQAPVPVVAMTLDSTALARGGLRSRGASMSSPALADPPAHPASAPTSADGTGGYAYLDDHPSVKVVVGSDSPNGAQSPSPSAYVVESAHGADNMRERKTTMLFKRKKSTAAPETKRKAAVLKALSTSTITIAKNVAISGTPQVEDVKKLIGNPFNFERKVHVDEQLNWFGNSEDVGDLFTFEEKLGEGSFGRVYRAVLKQTGFVLAVKEIQLSRLRVQEQQSMIEREINMLKKCVHTNTVQYYGCCRRETCIWILTDYCGGGSMSDILMVLADPETAGLCAVPSQYTVPEGLMVDPKLAAKLCTSGLTELEVAAITGGALEGLAFLHEKQIIHRDLKSANILLTLEGEVKIADFGVSEQITQTVLNRNTVVGTPYWMAPEVILSSGYDTSADIWSLGITVIELADGNPPHSDENPMRAIFKIPHLPAPTLAQPAEHSGELNAFIAKCLLKKPADRPPARALRTHPLVVALMASGPAARRRVLAPRVARWAAVRAEAAERERQAAAARNAADDEMMRAFNGGGDEGGGDADAGEQHLAPVSLDAKRQTLERNRGDDDEPNSEASGTMIIHDDDGEPARPSSGAQPGSLDAKRQTLERNRRLSNGSASGPSGTMIIHDVDISPQQQQQQQNPKGTLMPGTMIVHDYEVGLPDAVGAGGGQAQLPAANVPDTKNGMVLRRTFPLQADDSAPSSSPSPSDSQNQKSGPQGQVAAAPPSSLLGQLPFSAILQRAWQIGLQGATVALQSGRALWQVASRATPRENLQLGLQVLRRYWPRYSLHFAYVGILVGMRWYYARQLRFLEETVARMAASQDRW